MQHLEGSGTPVLYIGGTVLNVNWNKLTRKKVCILLVIFTYIYVSRCKCKCKISWRSRYLCMEKAMAIYCTYIPRDFLSLKCCDVVE